MCDSYGQECEILMLIKSLRISLPVFWTSNRPKTFHKAFEDTIAILQRANIQLILYLDDIIWMRRTSEEILFASGQPNFSSWKIWFYNQQEKFNFWTGPTITDFGSDYNYWNNFVCDKGETCLWQKRNWKKWQQNVKIDEAIPRQRFKTR